MAFQLSLEYGKPNLLFCIETGKIGWGEVVWGIENGIFNWRDVLEYANGKFNESNSKTFECENEISFLGKNDASRIIAIAREAAEIEDVDTAVVLEKWRYLLLNYYFNNINEIEDPWLRIEEIWAAFGYPSDMEDFIPFLPSTDDWKPEEHSREDNFRRLTKKWGDFLMQWRINNI